MLRCFNEYKLHLQMCLIQKLVTPPPVPSPLCALAWLNTAAPEFHIPSAGRWKIYRTVLDIPSLGEHTTVNTVCT